MIGVMPAVWQSRTASPTCGRAGSISPTSRNEPQSRLGHVAVERLGQRGPVARGNGQHAHAVGRHALDLLVDGRAIERHGGLYTRGVVAKRQYTAPARPS